MSLYLFPVVLNKRMMWSLVCKKRLKAGSKIFLTLREGMA
jgi:predicted transcriptional regulator